MKHLFITLLSLFALAAQAQTFIADTTIGNAYVEWTFDNRLTTNPYSDEVVLGFTKQVFVINGADTIPIGSPELEQVKIKLSENQMQFNLFANPQLVGAITQFLNQMIDKEDWR